MPAVRALSSKPILFTQVPALDTVQAKLVSFIDTAFANDVAERERTKAALKSTIIPFIKARNDSKLNTVVPPISTVKKVCDDWFQVTASLASNLPSEQLFPVIDLWRVGIIDNSTAAWCAAASVGNVSRNPVLYLLQRFVSASSDSELPKPTLLTMLRLLSNTFAHEPLARSILNANATGSTGSRSPRELLTAFIVPALLHSDAGVRTAAASLAFNIAALCQKPRVEAQSAGRRGEEVVGEDLDEGDWEVEMVSAVVEALRMETVSEDVGEYLLSSSTFKLSL